MDKLSSTKSAISEYRNSDFQISGSVISSHKNIHRVLKKVWEKGHSGTVVITGKGMSFLLIWKCSRDKVMILRDIKTDMNNIYHI